MTTEKNFSLYLKLGNNIRNLRITKGLTQKELAEKADVCTNVISQLENPKICKRTSLMTVFNIADALEIKADELLKSN